MQRILPLAGIGKLPMMMAQDERSTQTKRATDFGDNVFQ